MLFGGLVNMIVRPPWVRNFQRPFEFWPEIGQYVSVAYRIVFTENAIDDYEELDARWRATIQEAISIHLTHEPRKESKSRIKQLKDIRHPEYRLRVDEMRVFYDVNDSDVVIVAIMTKEKTNQWLEEHGEK